MTFPTGRDRRWLITAVLLAACARPLAPPSSPLSAAPPAAAARAGAPAASDFRHPGILTNRAQLEFVRARIKAGEQPWSGAYAKAMATYGSLSWTPRPRATVDCGAYSRPNNGCSDERNDAVAAYTHALAWFISGDVAHAHKAIAIMNAWAAVLRGHSNHNAPLQTGWAGSIWPLAAEIIRHTSTAWSAPDVAAFSRMLGDVYLDPIATGSIGTNGNWELVMAEAAAAIAIFLDDRPAFDRALALWRRRLPAYFYLASDGPAPVPPPGPRLGPSQLTAFWHGQTELVDGLSQETCRDFGHTSYGLASALAIAELAYQQGVDLYQEEAPRLHAAMEFHAAYLLGQDVPPWLCGGRIDARVLPTWEIGYNHFHGRLGLELPRSRQLIESKIRARGGVDHHIVWETLTHAKVGAIGLR